MLKLMNLRRFVAAAAAFLGFLTFSPTSALGASEVVNLPENYSSIRPGTIMIHTSGRALYFVLENNQAIKYPVAVPKRGKEWSGWTYVSRKHWMPEWMAPASVVKDHPELAGRVFAGGAPENPMGVAAIELATDQAVDHKTGRPVEQVAIHGTTQKMRKSIGSAASYGCIRMLNEDVADLFQRVSEHAPVWKMD